MKLKLYHYWRSSCSWRVRWGLLLKQVPCEFVHIDLLKNEQQSEKYLQLNPSGTVPTLEIMNEGGEPFYLSESTAILEWAEENFPSISLYPRASLERAKTRQLAQIVNAGIQPIQNLKVMNFYSSDAEKKKSWSVYWITEGLKTYEALVKKTAGLFSVGNQISMADLFLIPQCYNAHRFGIHLQPFPTIARIEQSCLNTDACKKAHPDSFQPS